MSLLYAPRALAVVFIFLLTAVYFDSIGLFFFSILLLLCLLFFYRPYTGRIPDEPQLILSPAQGRILDVKYHPNEQKYQVAIFLSVFNCHIQYAPCAGQIISQVYHPGTFHPAHLFEKSELNERLTHHIQYDPANKRGDVWVVQIAGLLARRITALQHPPHIVYQGEPLGLIHFGSRVDVWVNATEAKPIVVPNQAIEIGQPLYEWTGLRLSGDNETEYEPRAPPIERPSNHATQ